ncbi:hypothetical protein BOFE_08940 (plasmid) [Candidatus Borrelia fainii]|uniref:Outer membrane protein n=1 Tax=Candidatus Borrelia fainii TaxID=2518322 RepID=A0ABM8DLV6_9SPIR|nr:hypothetical protein [Candidatus Borrelia fainii]BDU63354.1 hypothetical protein BOFE_08940 [Candidatus Borrelia fainii]
MVKFRYIVLFSLFLFFNLYSAPFRPFDFTNWNFEREIEEAYEASYDVVDSVLVNVDDVNKNMKSKKILQRISELEGYYRCLVNMIRDDLFLQVEDEFLREYGQYFDDDVFTETDNRFKEAIEIPMENAFDKYRHRVLSFSNKTWIKNPDYTKLFIKLQLKEIEFVENYVTQKLGVNLGIGNGSLNGQRQSSQKQSSQRQPSQRQSSQRHSSQAGQRYGSQRPITRDTRDEYERQVGLKQSRPSDMVDMVKETYGDEELVTRESGESLKKRPIPRSNDESLKGQRQASSRQASSRQASSRQASSRAVNSRQTGSRSDSRRAKNVRPTGVKKSNIRPSSTRPNPKRPGSDIRPNFVRPIVKPLGEKPVSFRSEYMEGEN